MRGIHHHPHQFHSHTTPKAFSLIEKAVTFESPRIRTPFPFRESRVGRGRSAGQEVTHPVRAEIWRCNMESGSRDPGCIPTVKSLNRFASCSKIVLVRL